MKIVEISVEKIFGLAIAWNDNIELLIGPVLIEFTWK